MKAIVFHTYGSPDVLELKDIPKPTPKDNEVLIKVQAAAVNAGDWHLLRADPFLVRFMAGLFKPKINILGFDVAGEVEAVGQAVTQFQLDDVVFGDLTNCGFGAFAEYVAVPEHELMLKPANMSIEEAAAVSGAALTALQGLRDEGKIQAGQKVLIVGASGGVGTFAVQIAKAFGAEVTGVCSTRNLDLVRSIGADHVVDYTQEDVTQNGQQYDLILDAAAFRSIADYRNSLSPKGIYVLIGGSFAQFMQAAFLGPWLSRSGKKMRSMLVKPNQKDLGVLKAFIEAGQVASVIDRRYPLSETAEAIRYVETGRARGKVVITV